MVKGSRTRHCSEQCYVLVTMHRDPLLLFILAALPPACSGDDAVHHKAEGCMGVAETVTQCSAPGEVDPGTLWLNWECGYDIVEVLGAGTRKDITGQDGVTQPACCYPVDTIDNTPGDCVIGRPYFEGKEAITASVSGANASSSPSSRGAAWARAAAFEHASVAAFARLSLQLMAHGAPAALLGEVHRAALDETRHAEACLALARAFGADSSLSPFPFREAIDVDVSLEELAVAAVADGCIAETLGVVVAREAMAATTDTRVRQALKEIVEDESRHAALSYQIVAFALSRGGAAVRDAIVARLQQPWPGVDADELALRAGVSAHELWASAKRARAEVVAPALAALLKPTSSPITRGTPTHQNV